MIALRRTLASVLFAAFCLTLGYEGAELTRARWFQRAAHSPVPALRFLAVGDTGAGGRGRWGDASTPLEPSEEELDGADGPGYQLPVAAALERAASRLRPEFVLGLGDQVYPHGAASSSSPLFKRRFDAVYGDASVAALRRLPWYLTLGNHDCESGEAGRLAQVDRSKLDSSGRWNMPRVYYSKEFTLPPPDVRIATGGGRGKVKSATAGDLDGRHHDPRLIKRRPTRAKLVVLDACNLVCARSTPSEDLQPPPKGEVANFRCGVVGRDEPEVVSGGSLARRAAQLAWLERELRACRAPAADAGGAGGAGGDGAGGADTGAAGAGVGGEGGECGWLIVAAHWPVFSVLGNGPTLELAKSVLPLLRKYRVDAYFSGHDHSLQHIKQGELNFFVSGAGGYHPHSKLKPSADVVPESVTSGGRGGPARAAFAAAVNGFMQVSLSEERMVVEVVALNSSVLHTVALERQH